DLQFHARRAARAAAGDLRAGGPRLRRGLPGCGGPLSLLGSSRGRARERRRGHARGAGGGDLHPLERQAARHRGRDRGASRLVKRLARLAGWEAFALADAFVGYPLSILARLAWWRTHDPASTAFMEDRLERLRERKPAASLRHQWVPY